MTIRDLLVSQTRVTLARSGTTRLFARVQFSDGTGDDVTGAASWSSSDASVVAVQAGVLTAVGIGAATVTAAYQGQARAVDVVVRRNTMLVGSLTVFAPYYWYPTDYYSPGGQFFADGIPVKVTFTQLREGVWGIAFGAAVSRQSVIAADPGQHSLALEIEWGSGGFSTGGDGYVEIRDSDTGDVLERQPLPAMAITVAQVPDRQFAWPIDVGAYTK